MKRMTRLAALALVLAVLLSLCAPAVAAGDTFLVASAEDLMELSRRCSLDSWSRGKTVRLTADVDLSGVSFAPIPTFGGVFEGGGHTVSGLSLTAAGSRQGLFRTVQETGKLRDLTVTGKVTPGGSAQFVGGLVGVNRGTVQNCAFDGAVEGIAAVGGLVGLNETTGRVLASSVKGTVLGERHVGGVAGRNLGEMIRCDNAAGVNVREVETSTSINDIDVTAPLEQLTGEGKPLAESHSDVGGIVGYTAGVVQSCVNRGRVGYPHVGYNIGGVAGRQRGYLSGCENRGPVLGRKDVGGIVGQAEPDVSVTVDVAQLDTLSAELDKLNALIHAALDDVDDGSAVLSARLTEMGAGADAAKDHAQTLMDGVGDMVDGNVTSINLFSATVTGALDQAKAGMDEFALAADDLSQFARELSAAMDLLADAGEEGAALLEDLEPVLQNLQTALAGLKTAGEAVNEGLDHLQKSVVIYDQEAVSHDLLNLGSATYSLGRAIQEGADALIAMEAALGNVKLEFTGDLNGDLQRFQNSLKPLGAAFGDLGEAMEDMGWCVQVIGEAIWDIHDETELYPEELTASVDSLKEAITAAGAASDGLNAALEGLETVTQEAAGLSGTLGKAMDALSAASATASGAGEHFAEGFRALSACAGALTDGAHLELTPLGDEPRAAADGLFAALGEVSASFQELNGDLAATTQTLTADLGAIADQFNVVFALLIDVLYDMRLGESASDLSAQVKDVSDEELTAIRQGKTADSVNHGDVEGDRNVGGVAGAMAVEYDLDPEDDVLDRRVSYYAVYETRSVLQNCMSDGAVTAKKDCAGGVVGRADLGTVLNCRGYGSAESTGGSYVGGVAGYAQSTVRSSYARCRLSGEDYVGGVAGSAVTLRDCVGVATILRGREYVGAVAGDADVSTGKVTGNCCLEGDWAAIDSVSYEGLAQPVPYAALAARDDLPRDLLRFTLTLVGEGGVAAEYPIDYGQDLTALTLPEPPEKEGYYANWPELPARAPGDVRVEAQYTPWVGLLPSQEVRGPLALVLVDGQFTRDAVLHAAAADAQPPEKGAQVLRLTLEHAGDPGESLNIRVLADEDETVYVLEKGRWQKARGTQNGKYFKLTVPAGDAVVAVAPAHRGVGLPVLILGAALAAAGAAAVILLVRRRNKKEKTPAA